MKSKYSTKEIVLTGLGIATVFVATMYIRIPNAISGYFNLGDGFILLFSSFLLSTSLPHQLYNFCMAE